MNNYIINKEKRQVVITTKAKNTVVLNENDKLERIFLPGTQDKYECILVLLEVPVYTEDGIETEERRLEAFAQRVGRPQWVLPLILEEFNIPGVDNIGEEKE